VPARGIAFTGKIGIAVAVTGALSAAAMLAWPVQSPPELVRFPFTPGQFRVIQTWFFVHHLGMVAVLVGLARAGVTGEGRIGRIGAWLAVIGTFLLAVQELVTGFGYGDVALKTANEGAMGAGYGVSTNLIGLGMLLAGIAVVRARVWTDFARWVPLAIGVVHFVVVTPAIFSGGFVAARLAIGSWMLLFGALGFALGRQVGEALNDGKRSP
jgi:hypothetical protein